MYVLYEYVSSYTTKRRGGGLQAIGFGPYFLDTEPSHSKGAA